MLRLLPFLALFSLVSACTRSAPPARTALASPPPDDGTTPPGTCFLLYEMGRGELPRDPASSSACATRVTPASTFKIPHALAALDAGVVPGPDTIVPYDGKHYGVASWQRDQTMRTAIRNSVVWYFQRLATQLGPAREKAFLDALDYGNRDSSSGLTTFWLGQSLRISPEEQERFLVRLYEDALPVSKEAMRIVREILVQPDGVVVNAAGPHPFDAPWPPGVIVSAKTGAQDHTVWLVGHVERDHRAWVFVSCVNSDAPAPEDAISLAARSLRTAGVL